MKKIILSIVGLLSINAAGLDKDGQLIMQRLSQVNKTLVSHQGRTKAGKSCKVEIKREKDSGDEYIYLSISVGKESNSFEVTSSELSSAKLKGNHLEAAISTCDGSYNLQITERPRDVVFSVMEELRGDETTLECILAKR
jgi:hypothetical protein